MWCGALQGKALTPKKYIYLVCCQKYKPPASPFFSPVTEADLSCTWLGREKGALFWAPRKPQAAFIEERVVDNPTHSVGQKAPQVPRVHTQHLDYFCFA
jgi:hypothetical protein